MNTWFWILWGFDAIVVLVVLYFFLVGLADGSVSSFNMGIWAALLAGLAIVILGSLFLKDAIPGLAKVLLWILALPALMYLLFMVLMMTHKGRWN